jgi:hypothetical protein
VGGAPHLAIARVIMPATSALELVVDGFPPPQVRRDAQGQRFLVTERRLRRDEPTLAVLSIGIHGLPTQGPGRIIATLLSACGVAVGLAFTFGRRPRSPDPAPASDGSRAAILEELAELERARRVGDVGPRTYRRLRQQLIDSLARALG